MGIVQDTLGPKAGDNRTGNANTNALGTTFQPIQQGNDFLGGAAGYVGGMFGWKDKDARNAANREAAYMRQMAALGLDELGQYRADIESGPTDSQQMSIDKTSAAEQAQLKQALSEGGITSSTTALSGMGSIQKDVINMQDKATYSNAKEHWDNFVQATGISQGSSAVLNAMNHADRTAAMQIYSSTVGALGQIAGQLGDYKSVLSEYTNINSYDQGTAPAVSYDGQMNA